MIETLLIINVFLGVVAVYQRSMTINYLKKEKQNAKKQKTII